jgi:hypothetical protein
MSLEAVAPSYIKMFLPLTVVLMNDFGKRLAEVIMWWA